MAYKNNKERLGVDRVLNLIAASKKTENDLIVIDAGTATTVDYLDSKKRHLGGLILPSKELINKLFFEMLSFNFLEEDLEDSVFANTRSCIESGSNISAYNSLNYIERECLQSSKPHL